MWEIDEIYNEVYTMYESVKDPGIKTKIENLLIDLDQEYLHAQHEIREIHQKVYLLIKWK